MVTIHWIAATLLYILMLSVTVTESGCLGCLFPSKRSKDHSDIKVPVRRTAFNAIPETSNKKKSKKRKPEASKLLEFSSLSKSDNISAMPSSTSMKLSLHINQANSSTQSYPSHLSYVTQGTQTDETRIEAKSEFTTSDAATVGSIQSLPSVGLSNPSKKNSNPPGSAHTSVFASLHLLGTNITFAETSPEVDSSPQRSKQKRVLGVKRPKASGKTFAEADKTRPLFKKMATSNATASSVASTASGYHGSVDSTQVKKMSKTKKRVGDVNSWSFFSVISGASNQQKPK